MDNIRIAGIAYYHPKTTLSNDYFYNLYGKEKVEGLIKASGKEQRYVSMDPEENSLTMAMIASDMVIKKTNIPIHDIDYIAFTSSTPEYLMPSNAIKIHNYLGAKETCGAYDMNSNCDSMVILMDQLSKFMKLSKRIKKVLIVAGDAFFRYTMDTDPFTHSIFADSACAIILEKTKEESDIIDSIYFTDSGCHNHVHFPKYGFSKTLIVNDKVQEIGEMDKIINWGIGDADRVYGACVNDINQVLSENNLTIGDIKLVAMCQMFQSKVNQIQETLGMDKEKFPYIGDKYGYTGATSPFIALEHGIEEGFVKRGDYVLLWGLGAGITTITMLIKY